MRVFVKRGAAGGGGQRPYAVTNSGVTSPIHQTGAADLAPPVRRRSGPLGGRAAAIRSEQLGGDIPDPPNRGRVSGSASPQAQRPPQGAAATRSGQAWGLFQPATFPEVPHRHHRAQRHQHQRVRVAASPFEFGHPFKVHAVHAGNECGRK